MLKKKELSPVVLFGMMLVTGLAHAGQDSGETRMLRGYEPEHDARRLSVEHYQKQPPAEIVDTQGAQPTPIILRNQDAKVSVPAPIMAPSISGGPIPMAPVPRDDGHLKPVTQPSPANIHGHGANIEDLTKGPHDLKAVFDPPQPPPPVTTPSRPMPVHVIDPNYLPAIPSGNMPVEDKVPTIEVVPGENHLLEIAINHLNRLTTPFKEPEIRTVSRADISVNKSTIYVATTTTDPVTLFVTERGREDVAMAVTLIPRNIVPQEYRLVFQDTPGASIMPIARAEGDAGEWETSSPYVDTIKEIMRNVAIGDLPPGYTLRKRSRNDPLVYCNTAKLDVQPAQIMEGHAFVISVARAINISGSPMELDESVCYTPGVAAVAAWPGPYIKPDGAIELFVLHQRQKDVKEPRKRPSLIQASR